MLHNSLMELLSKIVVNCSDCNSEHCSEFLYQGLSNSWPPCLLLFVCTLMLDIFHHGKHEIYEAETLEHWFGSQGMHELIKCVT